MIKSTNNVTQMFVATNSVDKKAQKTSDGKLLVGYKFIIDDEDTTDLIPVPNTANGTTLSMSFKKASDASEKLPIKALHVVLNPEINGGEPVPGEDYTMLLRFRGNIGEEDTIEKVVSVRTSVGETKASFYKKLAQAFIDNSSICGSDLFYVSTTNAMVSAHVDASTIGETGFYIVEPKPYWRLGTFAESTMKIDVTTRPIIVGGVEEGEWLTSYKFVAEAGATTLPNTHKVADMEYFYKGERGVSAFLNAPYADQLPVKLKVDADHAAGYDILTIHYAYVGDNASNQKSEKDIVIVAKTGTAGLEAFYKALYTEYLGAQFS